MTTLPRIKKVLFLFVCFLLPFIRSKSFVPACPLIGYSGTFPPPSSILSLLSLRSLPSCPSPTTKPSAHNLLVRHPFSFLCLFVLFCFVLFCFLIWFHATHPNTHA